MSFKKILVVCAGNICRSPMGEFFFKEKLVDKGFTIDSAGIVGLTNHPADETAINVMNEININMSSHVAKKLNAELIKSFDLILVMEMRQLKDVEQQFQFSKGKVFRMAHWQDKDISDPYKRPKQAFIEARDLIQESVDLWISKLT